MMVTALLNDFSICIYKIYILFYSIMYRFTDIIAFLHDNNSALHFTDEETNTLNN